MSLRATLGDGSRVPIADESLIDAIKRVLREAGLLVREELDLAKAEITQKLRALGLGAGFLIVAALLAVGSLATLSASLILVLSLFLAPWVAGFIVTACYLVFAIVLALTGRRFVSRAVPPIPNRTIQTLKENVEWLKTRTKSKTL